MDEVDVLALQTGGHGEGLAHRDKHRNLSLNCPPWWALQVEMHSQMLEIYLGCSCHYPVWHQSPLIRSSCTLQAQNEKNIIFRDTIRNDICIGVPLAYICPRLQPLLQQACLAS